MDTIRLVQSRVERNPVEKERIQRNIILSRKSGINGIKLQGIILAKVAWSLHAGKNHPDTIFFQFYNDRFEVGISFSRRQSTQGIIATKLNKNDMRFIYESPFQPGQATGGRITGDTGIDDVNAITGHIKGFFKSRREGVFRFQSVAGTQAVTKHQKT